jgi:hypothetical protein
MYECRPLSRRRNAGCLLAFAVLYAQSLQSAELMLQCLAGETLAACLPSHCCMRSLCSQDDTVCARGTGSRTSAPSPSSPSLTSFSRPPPPRPCPPTPRPSSTATPPTTCKCNSAPVGWTCASASGPQPPGRRVASVVFAVHFADGILGAGPAVPWPRPSPSSTPPMSTSPWPK